MKTFAQNGLKTPKFCLLMLAKSLVAEGVVRSLPFAKGSALLPKQEPVTRQFSVNKF